MQTEKSIQVKQSHENLFRDSYGILKLAADATLTKTLASSEIAGYLSSRRMQWTNILVFIKRLWQSNRRGMPFCRCSKKINLQARV